MEIAFTVTKLGPLSQIAIPIIGIDKLVYLAYHAYGWYKSPEQALTLEQTLGSSGASLVATSTFNVRRYCNIRQDQGGVYGTTQGTDGSLTRILLPKASTATEGSSGLICLRALVIGLLCFIRPPQITSILKKVLPRYLLNHELEGDVTELQGACVAAIFQYVTTISKEEDTDSLPGRLQDHTDRQLKRVSNATLFELQSSQRMDIAQVTGLLSWILTPLHSRQNSVYATKSAKVWALALVLSESLALDGLQISERVAQRLSAMPRYALRRESSLSEQSPAVAFSELVLDLPYLNSTSLEIAFFETFAHVQRCLRSRPWFCHAAGLQDCLEPIPQDCRVWDCLGEQQRDLLIRYTSSLDQDQRRECIHILMQHIILAGTLAIVTLFVHQEKTDSGSAIDVNIVYDAPFSNDIDDYRWPQQDWAQSVGADLWDMKGLFEPNNSEYHGAFAFAPSDKKALRSRRQVLHEQLCHIWANDMAQILVGATLDPKKSIFGAQNHGLAHVSSFALQPSMKTSAPFIYHMQRGQLLDIPTKGGLIFDGLEDTPLQYKRRILDESYRISAVEDMNENPVEVNSLRWDLDPCWETDVQTCCVNLRVGGLPVLQLSLHDLLRSIEFSYPDQAPCAFTGSEPGSSCQDSHSGDTVAHSKHLICSGAWYRLPLLDMLRQGQLGISDIDEGEPDVEKEKPNWLVYAHGNEILTMLALNCTFTHPLKPEYRILADCLPAGLEKAKALGYPATTVMIVLHGVGS
ncbi:MAG: hypothetical protein M1836_004180 [Candelina mexicana]|nr:MAG: hypothetical protein M1836_004180 [Candelina mexicana]